MKLLLGLGLTILFFPLTVLAEPDLSNWYLPAAISDQNTNVRFEVDSTWHLVKGVTANLSGNIQLLDPEDPTSVEISLSLPVAKFDTGNSMRDDRMREVMAADEFQMVTFSGQGLKKLCTPALVLRDRVCEDLIRGELKIRSNSMPIDLPVQIGITSEKSFKISGKTNAQMG